MKSIDALGKDGISFVLNNREQFENKYSKGTEDKDGNRVGPRWGTALEEAFATQRSVGTTLSMQINREDKQINFAELLAQRCAASAEEAITLGTIVSLGIREYKDKKGFVPKEKERLQELLAQYNEEHARADNAINALVESGFELVA